MYVKTIYKMLIQYKHVCHFSALPKNHLKAKLKECTFLITLYRYVKTYFPHRAWK
jgi:hypothetical protein